MPVAALLADLVTVVCVLIVLGMGAVLIARGTRKRPEDQEDADPGPSLDAARRPEPPVDPDGR